MNLTREQFDYYTRISALGEGNATVRYASVSEDGSVSWTECFRVYDDVENFDKDCEDPITGRITGNIMEIYVPEEIYADSGPLFYNIRMEGNTMILESPGAEGVKRKAIYLPFNRYQNAGYEWFGIDSTHER